MSLFVYPSDLADEQLRACAAEALRRGLHEMDLSDLPHAMLTAELSKTTEGRKAMKRALARRSKLNPLRRQRVTDAMVPELRRRFAAGETAQALATELECHIRTIWRALNKKS